MYFCIYLSLKYMYVNMKYIYINMIYVYNYNLYFQLYTINDTYFHTLAYIHTYLSRRSYFHYIHRSTKTTDSLRLKEEGKFEEAWHEDRFLHPLTSTRRQ